ncbi:protein TolR [Rhizomicrobium electricum]|jgi:biopolymer transport protein TolR|uniref:Protein TolR n=1 Tax=Rhizomicrobium electricum TaxID=480070 RepID=A0ABP3PUP1_9PROT|nr:protein TolR [Rhizomicrobium electricum]NIJ50028.1 biopolymer transport protein TolR [Rhizomicrobium electricum]
MGAVIPSPGGGRRGGKRRPLAEINVTPFVDVMLVLLIIFMVTAPLLNPAIPVDLPHSKAQPVSENREPLSVTIKKDGRIYLMDKPIAAEDLVVRLKAIAENGVEERIYVRGDTAVPYGRVIEVMGILNAAGFTKVGLVTGPPKQNPNETK